MKYAARMFAIVMMMTPLLASAQLGSSASLTAKVPFQFRVGNNVIPAGQCVVKRGSLDGRTLIIGNWGAKVNLISTASMTEAKQTSRTNAMVFRKYGDRYFLTGIKLEGSKTVYQLPQSKAEAELRAQNIPASEETLLALLQ